MSGVIGGVADKGVNEPVGDILVPPRFEVLELRDGEAEDVEEAGTPPALLVLFGVIVLLLPLLLLLSPLLLLTNSMVEDTTGVAEVTIAPTKDPPEGLVAGLIFGPWEPRLSGSIAGAGAGAKDVMAAFVLLGCWI